LFTADPHGGFSLRPFCGIVDYEKPGAQLRKRRIPMSQEGRRRAAKRKALMIRLGKLCVIAVFAICVVIVAREL
jgi:hypothetical protein